jgi:hypothetical protein
VIGRALEAGGASRAAAAAAPATESAR